MSNRLVLLDSGDEHFVDALRRAWDAGDAVAPIDARLPPPARAAVREAARPDEPVEAGDALVVMSSGTTGVPRAVVLTHEAVAASALATSARLAVEPGADHWLACIPLAHVGGLSVVTRALHTGTRLTVHSSFDASRVDAAARDGCTLTALVPAALRRIEASRFRRILLGGQRAPSDRPPNVVTTYGMTETGSGIVYDGVPLDGVEVRVDDTAEIHVRGPMLLRCYRDGSDPKHAGGWLATGDLGEMHGDRLRVHGRREELIISGGENVWPSAVEDVLASHPGVAGVAVVGRSDPEWGERVAAIVVPTDAGAPPSLDDLRSWAKERLPAFAAPTVVEVVRELPLTASGKVRRGSLRRGG